MDVEYSIGVNNRFAFLVSDDEDAEDGLQGKEKDQVKKEKEKVKKGDKKVAKPPAKDPKQLSGRKDFTNEELKRDGRWIVLKFLVSMPIARVLVCLFVRTRSCM